jgi:hypothetical protein
MLLSYVFWRPRASVSAAYAKLDAKCIWFPYMLSVYALPSYRGLLHANTNTQ